MWVFVCHSNVCAYGANVMQFWETVSVFDIIRPTWHTHVQTHAQSGQFSFSPGSLCLEKILFLPLPPLLLCHLSACDAMCLSVYPTQFDCRGPHGHHALRPNHGLMSLSPIHFSLFSHTLSLLVMFLVISLNLGEMLVACLILQFVTRVCNSVTYSLDHKHMSFSPSFSSVSSFPPFFVPPLSLFFSAFPLYLCFSSQGYLNTMTQVFTSPTHGAVQLCLYAKRGTLRWC